MPVSKEILQQILKEYEDRRAAEKLARENRQKEVYERLPEVKTIDDEIESFSLSAMGAYLKCGKDPHKALSRLRQRMDELKERREALLLGAGYPTDYMETRYACPLCKDTGYVQYEKCRCLKQELINRAYQMCIRDRFEIPEPFLLFPHENIHGSRLHLKDLFHGNQILPGGQESA